MVDTPDTVPAPDELRERLIAARGFLDLDNKAIELEDLRHQAASPDLWDDPDTRQGRLATARPL